MPSKEALETLLGNIEQMRLLLVDCATLIQSTTLQMQTDAIEGSETAERFSKWAMRVAIGSIVISIVVGVASIRYAQLPPTAQQADELVGKLEKQIGALAAAGKEDRARKKPNFAGLLHLFIRALQRAGSNSAGWKAALAAGKKAAPAVDARPPERER
jgi:hypothetical protein